MLIISGVTASLAIFNGLYPAISRSSGAITSASDKISERIQSRIEIIQVSNNTTTADVWVKNVGTSDIDTVENSDVFFGPEGDFYRVAYGGETPPYWNYEIEGDNSRWRQTVTIKITIHPESSLSTGTYMVKIVIPNGISDETTFGVE